MKANVRRCFQMVETMLSPFALQCEVVNGGKHPAILVRGQGGLRAKFPVSCSPENEDNQLGNVRQEVMRWLEQSGFQTGRGVMGERRKREKRVRVRSIIHRYEVAIDPETGPACDPWDILRGMQ